jgi:hypothetical protein
MIGGVGSALGISAAGGLASLPGISAPGGISKPGGGIGGTAGGSGVGATSFILPLNDLGNGSVNLALLQGVGPATFTRVGPALTKLASGLWASISTGVPRSCYLGRDTAVGPYGGYFPESAGIQLVTPSASIRDMTDASWVKVGVTAAKTATGITGVANTASTLTATAPGGTILQTLVAAASSRTYSVFLRRVTGSGTVVIQQGATTLDVTAQLNAVTYTRVQLNASVLNAVYGIIFGSSGDAIEADFNQFEALAANIFATSPMASAGAARAADVLSLASAGNIDFTQGTAFAGLTTNYTSNATAGNCYAIAASSTGRIMYLRSTGVDTEIDVNDGTNQVIKVGLSAMSTGVRKRVTSWGAAGLAATGDGVAPGTNVLFDGSMGSGAVIEIGHSGGTNQWGGTIAPVYIYLSQQSAAQMQALSAG